MFYFNFNLFLSFCFNVSQISQLICLFDIVCVLPFNKTNTNSAIHFIPKGNTVSRRFLIFVYTSKYLFFLVF